MAFLKNKCFLVSLMILTSNIVLAGELFQAGTLISLMNGVYQGSTRFDELLAHGDFGLGTTDSVKGEMVIFDNQAYLSDITGHAIPIAGSEKTPFAMIVRFHPDQTVTLTNVNNIKTLEKRIDELLPSKNFLYAIKVSGTFDIVGRTVAPIKNNAPLQGWVEKHQRIFNLKKVNGTLIVFRAPDYASPITVPGYHIHFISQNKTQVFHLYDVHFKKARVGIEIITKYTLLIPTNNDFKVANLKQVTTTSISKMENIIGV